MCTWSRYILSPTTICADAWLHISSSIMQEGKKGRLGTYCRRWQYVPMDDNMCSEGRYILSPTTICTKRQYVQNDNMYRHKVLLALLYYKRPFNSLSSFDNYLYDLKFCYGFINNFSGLCDVKCQYAIRIHTVWNIFNVGLLESFFYNKQLLYIPLI